MGKFLLYKFKVTFLLTHSRGNVPMKLKPTITKFETRSSNLWRA